MMPSRGAVSVLLLDVTPPVSGAALAREHGLRKVGGRPPLGRYLRQIWARRHFAIDMAKGKSYVRNQGGYLGQLWAIITPLLWAVLYFTIFGVLLPVNQSIVHFAAFLTVGLFLIRFLCGALVNAAGSIEKNGSLIASLQFPRALIPISSAISDLITFLPSLVVLFAVALVEGEDPRWQMLLLVPTVALGFLFAVGLSCITARLVSDLTDLGQLIPFVNRAIFYTSGVFFSIEQYLDGWIGWVMQHQPFAVYLAMGRSSLLEQFPPEGEIWAWGAGWAVVTCAVGFVYFWRAEAKYGRG